MEIASWLFLCENILALVKMSCCSISAKLFFHSRMQGSKVTRNIDIHAASASNS